MSYGFKPGAARARRDDPMMSPEMGPGEGGESEADPATLPSAVTVVSPGVKRYRATICRTVTQSAVVEFNAIENYDARTVSEELCDAVPPEGWTTVGEDSWCYLDNVQTVGDATGADPMTVLGCKPQRSAVRAWAEGAQRAISTRMTSADAIAEIDGLLQDVIDLTATPADTAEAAAGIVTQLEAITQQAADLQSAPLDDADTDAATAAVEHISAAAMEIESYLAIARETAAALAEGAAAEDTSAAPLT